MEVVGTGMDTMGEEDMVSEIRLATNTLAGLILHITIFVTF